MTLPTGPRKPRVTTPRGAKKRNKTQPTRSDHSDPPSPQTDARAENARAENLKQWGEKADLARQLSKLQEVFSDGEEIADELFQMVNDLGIDAFRRRAAPDQLEDRSARLIDPMWKLLALPGIGQVRFGVHAHGKVPVSIDGAKEFLLSTAEADLLAVLIHDDRWDDEGFPPFRSYRELANAYGARRGNRAGVDAVRVGIYRLRWHLMTAGKVSPALVEVRNGSARLRIRRPANRRGGRG